MFIGAFILFWFLLGYASTRRHLLTYSYDPLFCDRCAWRDVRVGIHAYGAESGCHPNPAACFCGIVFPPFVWVRMIWLQMVKELQERGDKDRITSTEMPPRISFRDCYPEEDRVVDGIADKPSRASLSQSSRGVESGGGR